MKCKLGHKRKPGRPEQAKSAWTFQDYSPTPANTPGVEGIVRNPNPNPLGESIIRNETTTPRVEGDCAAKEVSILTISLSATPLNMSLSKR